MPSVPSETLLAERGEPGPADRVVHVRPRVVHERGTGGVDEADLVVVQVDAVREKGALVERTGAVEAVGDAVPAAGNRVTLVGPVLGDVDVEADAEGVGRLAAGGERLVGERERGVGADHPAREREVLPSQAVEEAPVLGDARERPFRPVAVGRLVAEDGADAEAAQGRLDDVERPVDRVRRRVMVDERRGTGEERLHPADQGRRPDAVLVEGPVEPPPDPLQDLGEVRGRRERVGHPPCERGVEVRVGADVAGDDEAAGAVAAGPSSGRGDAPVHDVDVPGDDPHGVDRGDDGGSGQDHRCSPPPWCTRCGTAWSAAGDSFIGSRVRRMPSNA